MLDYLDRVADIPVMLEGYYNAFRKDERNNYPQYPEWKLHGQWFYLNYCEGL